ncbi:MAG TPA: response regulator [Bryobacteraceae bacterium]|nr:response regulator [Bryobacteraceae bacterium]
MSLHLFAKASGGAIAVASLAMIAGYATGIPLPLPFLPPWSCVAFFIIGCVLWGAETQRYPNLLRLGALAVLAIGAIVWGEYMLDKDLGFDKILFPGLLLPSLRHPGRPSALSGFHFCLLGMALLLLPVRRKLIVLLREGGVVTVITLCFFNYVTYVFNGFRTIRETMTPLTALLALVAAVSALILGRGGQLIPLFRDTGPAGLITRRLLPVPLVLPAFTMTVRVVLQRFDLYGGQPGEAIFASVNIMGAIAIVWFCCSKVFSVDVLRRSAEGELRRSRDDLDRQVHLRTRELVNTNELLELEVASRRKAQTEVQQTNAILSSLIEACPLAICAFNLDGSVRRSNPVAEAMSVPDDPRCRDLALRAGKGESVAGVEVSLVSRGNQFHLAVWASPILAADATLDGVVMMAADISERKALEAQIQQTQRLESLGVLAGGIAHDFNNLLTGVIGNASLMLERFPADSKDGAAVRSLLEAGEAMAKLTAQMLAYSGRGRFFVEALDLSQQVAQITTLIQASIPKNVRLRLLLESGLPRIDADASQLQQVIMNLVINAAEAIGNEQGNVEVSTFLRAIGPSELDANVTRQPIPPGNYVSMVVRDTGAGMDDSTKVRIFDPFFTTKFAGRGLGLSAVLGIIRGHRGALLLDSQPGKGTTFRVFFPVSGQPAEVAPPAAQVTARGRGTILVVDDEDVIRRTAQLVLTSAGYEVVTATDGTGALTAYEAMPGQIDAVLLDMTMPVMSGEETLARLLDRWPNAAVIVTSGYGEEEAQRRLGNRTTGFLQKPFTAAQLARKISDVLRPSRASGASG